MRLLTLATLLLLFASGCDRGMEAGVAPSPTSDVSDVPATAVAARDWPDVDNTAINARDRVGVAPTPLDQGQGQEDINVTATIRKRVVEQPISINGQNVKIITRDGKVTLRGPVKTVDEKQLIEKIAAEVAGAESVTSMLEVEQE